MQEICISIIRKTGPISWISLGEKVGCVAPCRSGDLVIALRSGYRDPEPDRLKN